MCCIKMKQVKKRINIKYFLPVYLFFITFIVSGQNDKYEEFIIGEKIYKEGCAWFKISSGTSYNVNLKTYESSSNLCYSFRIKDNYFQAGYHVSSNVFFTIRSYQKLNDLYVSYGLRNETKKSNVSVFAGPSFAYGGYYFDTDTIGRKRYKGFTQVGIVVNAEYTKKIYYDLGLGISLFGSYNKNYSVIGLQFHVYFSGAFKGAIK